MKIIDTKGRLLKQFAAMSRPKNSKREWNYMYFWAANQKEAEVKYKDLKPFRGEYMENKLVKINPKIKKNLKKHLTLERPYPIDCQWFTVRQRKKN